MAAIISIDAHSRNQPNKSKLALYKPFISLEIVVQDGVPHL